jgi:CRISPR type III-B/RAMP module RAMP protein Cmr1
MQHSTYTLTFLTPCFCAGANQAAAEIRPSSIRGQLRWWFRALGGSKDDEREIFGGIHGDAPTASALIVRVSDITPGPAWDPPRVDPNAASSYVWYFASVSGKTAGQRGTGPRWHRDAVLSPDTSFKLHILLRRPLNPVLGAALTRSLKAFLMLGSFGLRATRGLGTFTCAEVPFDAHILDGSGFQLEVRDISGNFASEIGSLVKGTRRALDMKSTSPSPFGSSSPRQTSAVWFRPLANNRLAILEAPRARVLGVQSRSGGPIISNLNNQIQ